MADCKHKFQETGGRYFKYPAEHSERPDQRVAYQRLFCVNCGDTKEIIAYDHRPVEQATR